MKTVSWYKGKSSVIEQVGNMPVMTNFENAHLGPSAIAYVWAHLGMWNLLFFLYICGQHQFFESTFSMGGKRSFCVHYGGGGGRWGGRGG